MFNSAKTRSKVLPANSSDQFKVNEGQSVIITGAAGTAGVVSIIDATTGKPKPLAALVVGQGPQLGPYVGVQRLSVSVTAGSATVDIYQGSAVAPAATVVGGTKVGDVQKVVKGPGQNYTTGVWKADGTPIANATSLTYTRQSSDINKILTFVPDNATFAAYAGMTSPNAPGAPTMGTPVAGNATITAPYNAPADNGGSPITTYDAFLINANGDVIGALTSVPNPVVFTSAQGVANGSAFRVAVRANNIAGPGPMSAYSTPVTPSGGSQPILNYDLVIYGASWPGIEYAIKAKQKGLSVLLVDPRDDLGGMVTRGIQFTDAHSEIMLRACIAENSITNELYANAAAYYGISQQAYFRDFSYSLESHVAKQLIQALMTKYGITATLNNKLTAVTRVADATNGDYITDVTFDGIGKVNVKQVNDNTYTSDLARLYGMPMFIGGEAAATYSEASMLAGVLTSGTQTTNPIDPYIVPGDSSSGLIKHVLNEFIGTTGAAVPNRVQFGGLRINITNNPTYRIPFPAPANYVASDYELNRRHMKLNQFTFVTGLPDVILMQTPIPNVPNNYNKRDGNDKGFISLDYPNVAENVEYITATWARRAQIEENAKQWFLGLMYFFGNDAECPAAFKANVATWGLTNDEYQSNGGIPPYMYLREGARVVTGNPVKSTDLGPNGTLPTTIIQDPVGLGYYRVDSHKRQFLLSNSTGSARVIQEGWSPASQLQPAIGARIGMKVLYGNKADCRNMTISWGGNMTRTAYCAIRVEPQMGVIAGAGALVSAYAIANNMAVQDVPYSAIKDDHNLFGLAQTGGRIVMTTDNTTVTGSGTVTQTGFTVQATTVFGTASLLTCSATAGVNAITFPPIITVPGTYKVQLKYSDNSSVEERGNLSFVVRHAGTDLAPVVVNQSYTTDNSGDWMTIATTNFTAGDLAGNRITATYDNSGKPVNMVAIRLVPA